MKICVYEEPEVLTALILIWLHACSHLDRMEVPLSHLLQAARDRLGATSPTVQHMVGACTWFIHAYVDWFLAVPVVH
jgi:hypothetical protein